MDRDRQFSLQGKIASEEATFVKPLKNRPSQIQLRPQIPPLNLEQVRADRVLSAQAKRGVGVIRKSIPKTRNKVRNLNGQKFGYEGSPSIL